MKRRSFLKTAAAAPLAGAMPRAAHAARPASYGEAMPDMLLSYLAREANVHAAHWDAERAKIRTAADVEKRNRFVREKFVEMLRGFPERCDLSPTAGRIHEREGYRIENVMFQSRPDFWVPGNLYVPSGSGPFPGIISPCGHSREGRTFRVYQSAYIALAKKGFVVLAYDAIGQGERRYYFNPQTNQTESYLGPTDEHSMPGQLLILLGENLTQYRVWDGMRAIDYLLTRKEVDPARIGCTGNSGGGTLTMFISALDERVKCAAVSEGGTGHRWPSQVRPGATIGPADAEQNLFPSAIYGIDFCDVHVAIAPRPLLALIENYNPRFDEAATHIRARYEQLGAGDKFAAEEAADPHAWTPKLRAATVDWFCRWFYGTRGPAREPEFETEKAGVLYCTPNGSLRYSRQGKTIFNLIAEKEAKLPPPRELPADPASYRKQMGEEIRRLLRYKRPEVPLSARHLVTTPRKKYDIEKIEFLSEPGIYIPTWVFLPEQRKTGGDRAVLFVSDAGKDADGMEFGLLERIARQGNVVVAVDVRGIGETRPPHHPAGGNTQFPQLFDVETAMSYSAWFIDRNLLGMRVLDVIRSVDYALSRPDVDRSGVRLLARGAGSLWALYAAVLDPRIMSLVCEGGLLSYHALASSDRYKYGANVFVPDVLKHFDLPQVAAALAGRPLALASLLDAMKRPVPLKAAKSAYAFTSEAYARAGSPGMFRILPDMPEAGPIELL